MPFAYSSEFREMVLEQIRAGRPVVELARDLEMHQSTLHRWKRQDRIDRGLISRISTVESAELKAARRIRELEAELAAVKRASELFDDKAVMRPKDLYTIVEALGLRGTASRPRAGSCGVSSAVACPVFLAAAMVESRACRQRSRCRPARTRVAGAITVGLRERGQPGSRSDRCWHHGLNDPARRCDAPDRTELSAHVGRQRQ